MNMSRIKYENPEEIGEIIESAASSLTRGCRDQSGKSAIATISREPKMTVTNRGKMALSKWRRHPGSDSVRNSGNDTI
jgi:hypothetical protein